MPTLVTFSKDWADEFQAEGMTILHEDELPTLLAWIEKGGTEWYFGTNEGWEDGETDMADFKFKEITAEEAETLERLIPDLKRRTQTTVWQGKTYIHLEGGSFGIFPPFQELDELED